MTIPDFTGIDIGPEPGTSAAGGRTSRVEISRRRRCAAGP